MSTLKIRKVGNSLGVIFPKEVQDTLNISEGDVIDFTMLGNNKVVLDSHLHITANGLSPKLSLPKKTKRGLTPT